MNIPHTFLKILLVTFLSLIATSCATTKKTTTATSKELNIYGPGVIQYPVVAEQKVESKKVVGKASGKSRENIENIKNNAIVDALKKADADVLIEPIFETEDEGNEIHVTVRGFPGTYTNFRQATASDIPLLDIGLRQKAKEREPYQQKEKKGNSSVAGPLIIFGSIMAYLVFLL